MPISRRIVILLAAIAVVAAIPAAASANAGTSVTEENVSWWWNETTSVGTSTLERTDHGVTARFKAKGLTPGHAVTLWVIHFNNPGACATTPCSIPADVFNEAAGADFYWVDGTIVGPSGSVRMKGSLAVGQVAHSGKVEVGIGDAVPLSDPHRAEVVLATHSHGPTLSGADLRAQLTSFTGGCAVFNGVDGFATGFGDLPDAVGECSTIQRSLHR
jgi:Cu/Zn superoxide dismutase